MDHINKPICISLPLHINKDVEYNMFSIKSSKKLKIINEIKEPYESEYFELKKTRNILVFLFILFWVLGLFIFIHFILASNTRRFSKGLI